MGRQIKIKSLFRVGVVVKDAEKTFSMFEKYFGVDRKTVDYTDTTDSKIRYKDSTTNGQSVHFDTKYMIFPLGGIEIELIQPLDANGLYAEFLAEHGEGLHHFNVDVDDVDAFREIMEDVGAPMCGSGHIETTLFKYYDSRAAFGMILESCEKKEFSDGE